MNRIMKTVEKLMLVQTLNRLKMEEKETEDSSTMLNLFNSGIKINLNQLNKISKNIAIKQIERRLKQIKGK